MSQVNESEEDQYIVNESSEINVGETIGWTDKLLSSLHAFKSRNYTLYFIGQLISTIGSWLQIVAEGWLIFQLSRSAFYVGLSAAASTLPALFLSLIGGVIVDRFPKKKVIMVTQTCSMILAFILGILTVTNLITVWQIILLAFLLGIVQAIDIPARQAYVSELVDDKKLLSSAIALNSTIYNSARVVGPTVAGLLIAGFGLGMAFLLNGFSYIAVIIALYFIKTKVVPLKVHASPRKAIQEGLNYAFSHPTIKTLLMSTVMISIFGWSYSTLMPVIAHDIFNMNASGLGYLYAATGIGALFATVMISAYSHKISPYIFIIGGNILFAIMLIFFTFTRNVYIAYFFLFVIGFSLVGMFAMINTTIQHAVSDNMRGRVMSIYTLSYLGFAPIGNFEIGYVAEKWGPGFAIRISAFIVLLMGLYFYKNLKQVKKAQMKYDETHLA
ncbi:MAG: MFS transporter [Candidatus Roizmanbacteria bacterium]|nr:MFS transporter [Candidatus Roizmanbacteria bacterium]